MSGRGRGKGEEGGGEWMERKVQSCWYWRLCRTWVARACWGDDIIVFDQNVRSIVNVVTRYNRVSEVSDRSPLYNQKGQK